MPNPLVRKLEHGARLSRDEQALLEALISRPQAVEAHCDLIAEGEAPEHVHLVLEGFACRYKILPDGSRQIMAWLLPGDLCDLHVSLLGEMDHGIATLTPSSICFLPRNRLEALAEDRPSLMRALWWATLVDEAILREWLVTMGRRPAHERIAHMFCEVRRRLDAVGLAPGAVMDFPLSQTDLADSAGLSPVHVNRMVQQLRDEGLIAWRGRVLQVLKVIELEAFAGFDPNYLHLSAA
ncbi:Crp/Fnr family transcriptional regulator [Phenylobacterium sp.]|uniref:Crp/Fnr family transcriptional regulator n=1 Tax=Phenylobacterium sp. TaxID=1871053 RepID=UPI002DF4895C|nr:Crp/Fnr family transcriptional regulator [Phenylobacterium sp.]